MTNSYRAFLAALLGCFLSCVHLHAIVISHSGEVNITIANDFEGVYLDLTNEIDATAYNTATSEPIEWDINPFYGGGAFGSSDTFLPVLASTATNSDILNLSFGDSVSSSSDVPTGFSGSTGHMGTGTNEFESGTSGYIGFALVGDLDTYYGWMRLTLHDDGSTGVIHEWAWDTDGDSITVGAVPEPGNAALLVGLAATFCAVRRRRRIA